MIIEERVIEGNITLYFLHFSQYSVCVIMGVTFNRVVDSGLYKPIYYTSRCVTDNRVIGVPVPKGALGQMHPLSYG